MQDVILPKRVVSYIVSLIFILAITSCGHKLPKTYKIYVAPIENKTNWAQVDTQLLEYLHYFFNKIATLENNKERSDIQVYITVNQIQMDTHVSGPLDTPLLGEIQLYINGVIVRKKNNYNFEFYEEAPFLQGQKEDIDYAMQRIYEKISTRLYFEIAKVVKSD
jgi:hypothetical protein